MSWQLDILTPDGQALKQRRTHANPTGVLSGFAWRWSRYGDCTTLAFDAFAPQLGAGNRDVLHLTVNGTDVFYGVVVETPHPRDPRRGQIDVVGASRLLGARVIGRDTYENVDVAVIVRDLVQKYRHPAIRYNAARIPDTGKVLSRFRMPWRKLDQALQSLGKAVAGEKGVPYGVLPNGEFFFGVDQAPAVPVAYSSVTGLKYLRVSGDDVVTRNHMLFMSQPSGLTWTLTQNDEEVRTFQNGTQTAYTRRGLEYRAAQHIFQVESAEHATYGAETFTIVPSGGTLLARLDPATLTLTSQSFTDVPLALDGNPATAAANLSDGISFIALAQAAGVNQNPLMGFRVLYASTGAAGAAQVVLTYSALHVTPEVNGTRTETLRRFRLAYNLPVTDGALREATGAAPLPQALFDALNLGTFTAGTLTPVDAKLEFYYARQAGQTDNPASGALALYSLEPLAVDRVMLDTLARKALVPPAQEPTEFTLPHLTGVMPSVVLTGAPGGDLTGDVVELEGRHGQTQAGQAVSSTVVKLEQPGASETARIIRIVARDRAADAQTELLDYLERP